MELNIVDKSDNDMHLEIIGESHTLLNMLKSVLLADERVHTASYDMKHVTISDPILYVMTDGTNPIAVVKDALTTLIAECDEFISVFGKAADV